MRGRLENDQRRLLEERLGHRFSSPDLLDQALTHASFANQPAPGANQPAPGPNQPAAGANQPAPGANQPAPGASQAVPGETLSPTAADDRGASEAHSGELDYDRLEFLGDAVVGMLLAEHAYRRAPRASSGDLTRRRAHLVRRSTLAAAAERLDLGAFVRISQGEAKQGGAKRRRLLADVFEAVIGAIYLDGGLEAARGVLERRLDLDASGPYGEGSLVDDPKSALQERLQSEGKPPPTYAVVEVAGPPHAPLFLVEALVEGLGAFRGIGGSRREAEREAARAALGSCTRA